MTFSKSDKKMHELVLVKSPLSIKRQLRPEKNTYVVGLFFLTLLDKATRLEEKSLMVLRLKGVDYNYI